MPIKITDRFIAPSRGTPEDVFKFFETNPPARLEDSKVIIRRIYELCQAAHMDFALCVSRVADETGSLTGPSFFVSEIYRERLNIAGLGVTDGEDHMIEFATGTEAAEAYMAHLFTYVLGENFNVDNVIPDDDPRYDATPVAWRGSVDTLQALTGKWFTNPDGAINSAARGNAIFKNIPDQQSGNGGTVADLNMTKGLIPLPAMERHIVDVSKRCQGDGRGYDNLGARRIDALYVHRSQGSWSGNISHFDSFCPGALTDIQIDHVTGKAMRFVDLAAPGTFRDAPSGWANGVVNNPIGDAAKLIAKHGGNVSAVNRFAESCEVTGFFGPNGDDPVSPAAKKTIAQWMASRAHDYGIPWSDFPLIKAEGRSFIIGHRESRGGKADDCPGDYIWSLIATEDAELIAMARAIMKSAQTKGASVPTEPTPIYADRITTGLNGKDAKITRKVTIQTGEKDTKGKAITEEVDVVYDVYAVTRDYEVIKKTKRRQGPNSRGPIVGPMLEVREKFEGTYTAVPRKQAGKKIPTTQYVITEIGTWVVMEHLTPRVSVRAA